MRMSQKNILLPMHMVYYIPDLAFSGDKVCGLGMNVLPLSLSEKFRLMEIWHLHKDREMIRIICLRRLMDPGVPNIWLGAGDTVPQWLHTFLTNQFQTVVLGDYSSALSHLCYAEFHLIPYAI